MTIDRVRVAFLGALSCCLTVASADPILLRYEGDAFPDEASPAWLMDPCEPPCSETLEGGHYTLRWVQPDDWVTAFYWITEPPEIGPESLWVEWRFRSTHPLPQHSYSCDAKLSVGFHNIHDYVFMYGDAVISSSGDEWVPDLDIGQFHTYRFESPDGVTFWFSVDGFIFRSSLGQDPDNGYDTLEFRGRGGCLDDWSSNMENAWDFLRYGELDYGEQIVETGPVEGFVDARQHPSLDRFTVRYDSANYVYIDEITVKVTPSDSFRIQHSAFDIPAVVATRRLDNGPPDLVEIVLDRPIPYSATTRFIFDGAALSQSIDFTYAPGDIDGDGQARLPDLAAFQNCFGTAPLSGLCPVLDLNPDSAIDLSDLALFPD